MAVSFPGIGSGLDVKSILDSIREQLALKSSVAKRRVESLQNQNTALEELRGSLNQLSSVVEPLRAANGGAAAIKIVTSSAPTVATATVTGSTESASLTVDVTSTAKRASGSFDRSFSSSSAFIINDPANAGAVKFAVGTGDNATNFQVDVNETTTAQDFVNSFNSAAGGKASASLVKLADNSYKITFASSDTGVSKGSLDISVDPVLNDPAALGNSSVTQATNAVFTINGVGTMERESNTITDAVAGLSINLVGTGSTNIDVKNDATATANRLSQLVQAYNSTQQFITKEDKVSVSFGSNGTVNTYGRLAQTNLDESVSSALRGAVSSARSSDGSTLASFGISTARDGTLSFDQTKFTAAYNANPDAANEAITALADKVGGVQGEIAKFTGFQRDIDLTEKANQASIQAAQSNIERLDRSSEKQLASIEKQFQALDKLSAQANSYSGVLARLLGG